MQLATFKTLNNHADDKYQVGLPRASFSLSNNRKTLLGRCYAASTAGIVINDATETMSCHCKKPHYQKEGGRGASADKKRGRSQRAPASAGCEEAERQCALDRMTDSVTFCDVGMRTMEVQQRNN